MDASEFRFSSDDGRVFTRKAYGMGESLAGTIAIECDGLTDYAAGIVVRLGVPRERANLEHAVRTAWLRARDAAPIIACTFTRGADSDWRFQYTVPTSDAAAAWAHATTKFHAKPAILEDMVENLINRPRAIGGGHFNLDLHVAPAPDEPDTWNIAVHALHSFLDGRACMMLLEHLLDDVVDIFDKGEGSAPQWGDEVTRLAPAMAACVDFSSNALDAPPAAPEPASDGALPMILFMPPLLDETSGPEGEHISISRIALDAKETADFRAATKRHGVTVTQAFTALLALADFETTLRLAVSADPDVYEKTAATYEQATHVLFAFYFISHRLKLPELHRSLGKGKVAPLCTVEGTPMVFDITPLRAAIKLDKVAKTVTCEASESTLKSTLAASIAAANTIPTDLETMRVRENGAFLAARTLDKASMFAMRAITASSIGDYDALGLMSKYRPAARAPFAVTRMHHGTRNNSPTTSVHSWQYDGRITFMFQTARRWTSREREATVLAAFKRWLDAFTAC